MLVLKEDGGHMNEKLPLISVITVCFNAEKDIEKTLLSVLNQTDRDYEYIIVDGNSTDNTFNIIEKYMGDFMRAGIHINVVSEQDNGIFDAMNRGIIRANGAWINFMNAGDTFYNRNILNRMKEYLKESKSDLVYGDCLRHNRYYSCLQKPESDVLLKRIMTIPHQATFIRTEVQKEHPFSLKYQIASDRDLFLKLYSQGYKFEYVPELICVFSLDGVSNTKLVDTYKEIYMVWFDNGVVDPNSFAVKVKYICGYIERFLEMTLPINLKWKLKAFKKKIISFLKYRKCENVDL